MKQESKMIATRVPKNLRDRMDRAIESGPWLNDSDFLRDAIRQKLDQIDRDSTLKESF